MGHPGPFSITFLVFLKQIIQFFQPINVKYFHLVSGVGIQTHVSLGWEPWSSG